jgi:hypothetical protein
MDHLAPIHLNVKREYCKRKSRIYKNALSASTQRVPATFNTIESYWKLLRSITVALSPTQKKDWMSETSRHLLDSHFVPVVDRLIQDQVKKDESVQSSDPLDSKRCICGKPEFMSSLKREIVQVSGYAIHHSGNPSNYGI